jgi:glucosamine-6-phosphate deaminase
LAAQNTSNFKITSTNGYDDFCLIVAKQIEDQLKKKPDSKLALPAGHSPRGYYRLLAQWSQYSEIDWRQATCFALDDYLDIDESQSFQSFLENHLYRFTNLRANARHNPRFNDNYDQQIAENGGIDLCVLGLGTNGHIAFNEPLSILDTWTHCVFLTNSTREANKDAFVSGKFTSIKPDTADSSTSYNNLDAVPRRAVTMGVATIMASKRIVLAVSGEHKKEILKRALYEKPDPTCPASFLMQHPNLLVITDFAFEGQ